MVKVEEHLEKIRRVKQEIRSARNGHHKNDLVRHYNRLVKELKECQMYMKQNEVI